MYSDEQFYVKVFGEPNGTVTGDILDMSGVVAASLSFVEVLQGKYVAPATLPAGDYIAIANASWDSSPIEIGLHISAAPLDTATYLGLRG